MKRQFLSSVSIEWLKFLQQKLWRYNRWIGKLSVGFGPQLFY
jgi:hypothetical protein